MISRIFLCLFLISFLLLGCSKDEEMEINTAMGLASVTPSEKVFDFEDPAQLSLLPSFGNDPSVLENGALKSIIPQGEHKGLGRKFWFEEQGNEPDEATLEFSLWLADNFQENGVQNEVGKFSGFEGIYDNTAGWGGMQVIDQKSWSVRIGHTGENTDGTIPIGLYVYHPGMASNFGTVVDVGVNLNKAQLYTLKVGIGMNTVGLSNGLLTLSVNGVEVYRSDTWLFRNDPSVHIRSVWLDTYIGGSTPSQNDTYTLMDDLKITWE